MQHFNDFEHNHDCKEIYVEYCDTCNTDDIKYETIDDANKINFEHHPCYINFMRNDYNILIHIQNNPYNEKCNDENTKICPRSILKNVHHHQCPILDDYNEMYNEYEYDEYNYDDSEESEDEEYYKNYEVVPKFKINICTLHENYKCGEEMYQEHLKSYEDSLVIYERLFNFFKDDDINKECYTINSRVCWDDKYFLKPVFIYANEDLYYMIDNEIKILECTTYNTYEFHMNMIHTFPCSIKFNDIIYARYDVRNIKVDEHISFLTKGKILCLIEFEIIDNNPNNITNFLNEEN